MIFSSLSAQSQSALLGQFDPLLKYTSVFPSAEAYKDNVLDPSIVALEDSSDPTNRAPLAAMITEDWMDLSRHQTFELFNATGILSNIPLKEIGGIFKTVSAAQFQTTSEGDLAKAMLETGLAATSQALSSVPNAYAKVAAAVIQYALFIWRAVETVRSEDTPQAIPLLELQNPGTESDETQVRTALAITGSGSDYTRLFAPRFDAANHNWVVQQRIGGWAFAPGIPEGNGQPAQFVTSGGLGMIPGMSRTTSVLQSFFAPKWGNADPYCRGDKATKWEQFLCGLHEVKIALKNRTLDVNVDCGSCIRWQSDFAPGMDVGTYYRSLNLMLYQLATYVGKPGAPVMFSMNIEELLSKWETYVYKLFDQTPYFLAEHKGWGWKAGVDAAVRQLMWSSAAQDLGVLTSAIDANGQIRGFPDWRGYWKATNVFDQVIKPSLTGLRNAQKSYLKTSVAAYIATGSGAARDLDVEQAKRDLLTSQARFSVRMRDVTDGDFYEALVNSGVRPGNTGMGKISDGAPGAPDEPPDEPVPVEPMVFRKPDPIPAPKGAIAAVTPAIPEAGMPVAVAVAGGAAVVAATVWAVKKRGRR